MRLLLKKFRASSRVLSEIAAFTVLCVGLSSITVQAAGLPNIVGRDLDGKITSLQRSFDGKPMVINFWWIKCAPCKQELPDLIAKDAAYPNVDFVYVHAETNAKTRAPYEIEEIRGFLDSQSLKLDQVIIGNTKARVSAGVEALPTTFLVNKNGDIEQVLEGFNEPNTKQIKNWLNERAND